MLEERQEERIPAETAFFTLSTIFDCSTHSSSSSLRFFFLLDSPSFEIPSFFSGGSRPAFFRTGSLSISSASLKNSQNQNFLDGGKDELLSLSDSIQPPSRKVSI